MSPVQTRSIESQRTVPVSAQRTCALPGWRPTQSRRTLGNTLRARSRSTGVQPPRSCPPSKLSTPHRRAFPYAPLRTTSISPHCSRGETDRYRRCAASPVSKSRTLRALRAGFEGVILLGSTVKKVRWPSRLLLVHVYRRLMLGSQIERLSHWLTHILQHMTDQSNS